MGHSFANVASRPSLQVNEKLWDPTVIVPLAVLSGPDVPNPLVDPARLPPHHSRELVRTPLSEHSMVGGVNDTINNGVSPKLKITPLSTAARSAFGRARRISTTRIVTAAINNKVPMLSIASTPAMNSSVVSALNKAIVGSRASTIPIAPQIANTEAAQTVTTAIAGS